MVAATRSQVSSVLGAPGQGKAGAAAATIMKEFGDKLSSTEASCNLINYTCLVNKSAAPEDDDIKPKAERIRPRRRNPGYRPSRRRYALPDEDIEIVASRANRPDNELLEPPNIQQDFGEARQVLTPALSPSTNPSTESIISPPPKLKFGMYAGRVKANPLKYLATVLRSKLQPHDESCNLLQIATEIHDAAKNKHNTTLRRIYDVVNVLEAAGLLERSNGHTSKRSPLNRRLPNECSASISKFMKGNSSSECMKSAVDYGAVVMECHDERIDIRSENQTLLTAAEPNPLEKKGTRGSRIRWLGFEAEHKKRFQKETLRRLTADKIATSLRVSKKQLEFEYLQEELRLTMELINHNQNVIYESDSFESNMNPCTPPPEDLSYSYLNFEDSSPSSAETDRSPEPTEREGVIAAAAAAAGHRSKMCESSSSSKSRELDPELHNPSLITENDDLNFWYTRSEREFEMNGFEAAQQYQSNGLPPTTSAIAKKALNVPFVILQTSNATNVEIELDGNVTSEVYIVLDNGYKLFDYRELLSTMFPALTFPLIGD